MPPTRPCCQDPASLSPATSPFTRIIALGFYDGPTSGVLQCETCARVYRFDILDWDDDHEVRVFRLAVLPSQSLDECVAIFAQTDAPRWPVWVPERSKLPSEEARESADRAVEGILHQAESAELLVAWAGYGQVTLVAKQVPVETLRELPDWFSVENLAEIPA